MVTITDGEGQISVPSGITTIDAFREWQLADTAPEYTSVWWLNGDVWVDMSGEQIFTHVRVKTVVATALDTLVEREGLGMIFTDGVLWSNYTADLAGKPDGLFLSTETLASDRIRLLEGKDGGFVELQGAPDMVLEVISASSKQKDTVTLMAGYWAAGVREYWLIDARDEPLLFEIYRRGPKRFNRARVQDGWSPSAVFAKSFRLRLKSRVGGHPNYALDVR